MSDEQVSQPSNLTSSIILTANGPQGFQKWNGGDWEHISTDLPDETTNAGGGLPTKVLELIGIPQSYSDNLYTEFVEDVQVFSAIPSQTANTFYGLVNWLCGKTGTGDATVTSTDDASSAPKLPLEPKDFLSDDKAGSPIHLPPQPNFAESTELHEGLLIAEPVEPPLLFRDSDDPIICEPSKSCSHDCLLKSTSDVQKNLESEIAAVTNLLQSLKLKQEEMESGNVTENPDTPRDSGSESVLSADSKDETDAEEKENAPETEELDEADAEEKETEPEADETDFSSEKEPETEVDDEPVAEDELTVSEQEVGESPTFSPLSSESDIYACHARDGAADKDDPDAQEEPSGKHETNGPKEGGDGNSIPEKSDPVGSSDELHSLGSGDSAQTLKVAEKPADIEDTAKLSDSSQQDQESKKPREVTFATSTYTSSPANEGKEGAQRTTSQVQLELNQDLRTLEDVVKKLYKNLNKKGPLTIVANFKPKKDGELELNFGTQPKPESKVCNAINPRTQSTTAAELPQVKPESPVQQLSNSKGVVSHSDDDRPADEEESYSNIETEGPQIHHHHSDEDIMAPTEEEKQSLEDLNSNLRDEANFGESVGSQAKCEAKNNLDAVVTSPAETLSELLISIRPEDTLPPRPPPVSIMKTLPIPSNPSSTTFIHRKPSVSFAAKPITSDLPPFKGSLLSFMRTPEMNNNLRMATSQVSTTAPFRKPTTNTSTTSTTDIDYLPRHLLKQKISVGKTPPGQNSVPASCQNPHLHLPSRLLPPPPTAKETRVCQFTATASQNNNMRLLKKCNKTLPPHPTNLQHQQHDPRESQEDSPFLHHDFVSEQWTSDEVEDDAPLENEQVSIVANKGSAEHRQQQAYAFSHSLSPSSLHSSTTSTVLKKPSLSAMASGAVPQSGPKQYRTTVYIPSGPPRHNSYRDMFMEKRNQRPQQKNPAPHNQTIYVDLSSKSARMHP